MHQFYLRDFELIRNKKISPFDNPTRIVLIFFGICFSFYFLNWFLDSTHVDYRPLYYLLAFCVFYSIAKYYVEWFFTFSLKRVEKPIASKQLTVDILTTYCEGEPKEMVVNTLKAIQQIKYPHTTFLCDEENDQELKEVCRELNVVHVSRNEKIDAKAGNINNTLQRYATGEICLILDPDHVPHPDFLNEVLAYFADDSVGFVQVVQGYYNQDFTVIAKAAAEQSYFFYGPIMMGLNTLGSTPAIGANCIFRRKALNSINGHASGLTEDMHTSMLLHAAGWKSVYVPAIVSRGLVPWNFSSYCKQQLKWSRGVFELMIGTLPRVFKKLTIHQRVYYLSCGLFYLYGVKGLLDILIPVLSLLLVKIPLKADLFSFLQHYLPLLMIANIIRQFNQRWLLEDKERGLHLLGAILLKSSWWVAVTALVYLCIGKKVPYIPTPKDATHETPWKLFIPNFIAILISLVAIIYGLKSDLNPYSIFAASIAFLNVIILSIGTLMGAQHLIRKIHRLFSGTFINKGSRLRTSFYFFRLSLYRTIQYTPIALAMGLILFVVVFNIAGIEMSAEKSHQVQKKNFGGNYVGLPVGETRGVNQNKFDIIAFEVAIEDFNVEKIEPAVYKCYSGGKIPLIYLKYDYNNYDSLLNLDRFVKFAELISANNLPMFFCLKRDDTNSGLEESRYYETLSKLASFFSFHAAGNVAWVWEFSNQPKDALFERSKSFVSWGLFNLTDESTPDKVLRQSSGMPVIFYHYNGSIEHYLTGYKRAGIPSYAIIYKDKKNLITNSSEVKSRLSLSVEHFEHPKLNHDVRPAHAISKSGKDFKVIIDNKRVLIKGMAYNPGHDWRDNSMTIPLTMQKVDRDFSLIKDMGCNVIRRYSPGIYDYNILTQAEKHKLYILYGFWFDPEVDYFRESGRVSRYRDEVISKVMALKDTDCVIGWSIGNEASGLLKHYFGEPYLTLVRKKYTNFIEDLAREIKKMDSVRPVSTMVEHTPFLSSELSSFHKFAPSLDFIGVNSYYGQNLYELDSLVKVFYPGKPYLLSEFGPKGHWVESYNDYTAVNRLHELTSYEKASEYQYNWTHFIKDKRGILGGVAFCWQDRFDGTATWFGITDIHGYKKPAYYALAEMWTGIQQNYLIQDLRIFKNGGELKPGNRHTFYVATASGVRPNGLQYKWVVYDETLFKKVYETDFVTRPGLALDLPRSESNYRLYVHATSNFSDVVTASYPLDIEW